MPIIKIGMPSRPLSPKKIRPYKIRMMENNLMKTLSTVFVFFMMSTSLNCDNTYISWKIKLTFLYKDIVTQQS